MTYSVAIKRGNEMGESEQVQQPHLPKLTKLQCTSSLWCLLDLLSQCTVVLGFSSICSNALPKIHPKPKKKKPQKTEGRKEQKGSDLDFVIKIVLLILFK